MIVSLGMYDWPETAAANDAFWALVRQELGYGPEKLDRDMPLLDVWQSKELLLSQTCGMPYRTKLHGQVQLVGTPDYGLPDTKPGYYYSVFVTRKDDSNDVASYRDRVLAYNGPDSQSGWAAPQNFAAENGFTFSNVKHSGGHLASAQAVANGQADIAATDIITWNLICRYEKSASELKVIGRTRPTPGLPFITAMGRGSKNIFAAVEVAIAGLSPVERDLTQLNGIIGIPEEAYLEVPTPPAPCRIGA